MQKLPPPILQIILDDLDSESQSQIKQCNKLTNLLSISHLICKLDKENPFKRININKLKYLEADQSIEPEYYPHFAKMTNLYSLAISDSTIKKGYSYNIISKLPLKKLEICCIFSNKWITNSCIAPIITLTDLDINDVPNFSDDALVDLKNIKKLNIGGNKCKISGRGFMHMKLTHLYINNRSDIRIEDISHLSQSLEHLEIVNCILIYPKDLGNFGIQSLKIGGKHVDLKDLDIKTMKDTLSHLDSYEDKTMDLGLIFKLNKLRRFKVWWNKRLMQSSLVSQLDKLKERDPPVEIDPPNYNQQKNYKPKFIPRSGLNFFIEKRV